jgi:hypothetical protein
MLIKHVAKRIFMDLSREKGKNNLNLVELDDNGSEQEGQE